MSQVRVEIRSHQLAAAAEIAEADGGVFVPLAEPPPVRTVLRLTEEGKELQALEVTRVVEVHGNDGRASGVVGRYVGLDELARSERVGTEHLEGGVAAVGEDGAAAMAVPAPVVDPDPSSAIDLEEVQRLEAEAQSSDAAANEQTESAPEESAGSEDGSRKKRRRGRKKR